MTNLGRGGQRTTMKRKHAPRQTRVVEEEAGSEDDPERYQRMWSSTEPTAIHCPSARWLFDCPLRYGLGLHSRAVCMDSPRDIALPPPRPRGRAAPCRPRSTRRLKVLKAAEVGHGDRASQV